MNNSFLSFGPSLLKQLNDFRLSSACRSHQGSPTLGVLCIDITSYQPEELFDESGRLLSTIRCFIREVLLSPDHSMGIRVGTGSR